MLYVVIIYLELSILLYVLLGGADFGAGIIELFTAPKNRSHTRVTLYKAIGPVWEANHMWLIIVIVILFVGFPLIYSTMSVYLHIPLLIMLMGIIARGTAFVFRHHDAIKDDLQEIYNKIFVYSSIITPLFLGIIAGAVISGRINPEAGDFLSAYIFSWLHVFSLAVGFFTVALCGFLAAVYLIGEAADQEDKRRFIRKARWMNIAAWILGALVFAAAEWEQIPLREWVFGHAAGLTAVIAAACSQVLFWYLLRRGKTTVLRVLAAFQVGMILLAVGYAHFPDFILLQGGDHLSLLEHAASAKTMNALAWALLAGSVFILPFLFYLFYIFQQKRSSY